MGEIQILLTRSGGHRFKIHSMRYLDLGALLSISQVSRDLMLWPFICLILSLGPSVSVMGSFLASTLPSVTCYLDGNVFPLNNISLLHLNSVPFCSLEGIVPKATPSNLTVVASGTTDNPFLFDRIQYEPDASVILDNATVVVDAFDNQIQYGSGWNKLGIIGMETSVQGASITFDFIGAFGW